MSLPDYEAKYNTLTIFATLVAGIPLAWMVWKLWRFHISPAMSPHFPSPLPYSLPYLGHLRGIMKDPQTVFAKGIEHFPTRPIFSVTVMGEELYIATSAHDVNAIYKDTQHLDFDAVIRDLLTEFGIAKETLRKLFDPTLLSVGPGTRGRNWMDRQHDVYRAQMLPGSARGDALAADLVVRIDHAMQWMSSSSSSGSSLLRTAPIVLGPSSQQDDGYTRISLWKCSAHVLVDAATRAFFGDALLAKEPAFVADYLEFDENYWRLKAKSPKTAAERKEKCVLALRRWLDRPKEERGDACWMVAKTEQDFAEMGIRDNAQLAALLFINYEVINGNAYKSAFWLLAHLLFRPEFLDQVRNEVDAASLASHASSAVDMAQLLDTTRSPHLNAAYDEVLRHANNAMGIRLVTGETTIGGKTLRLGRKLLMPFRQLHLDEASAVWGERPAADFDPGRFLRDKDLPRSLSFRPFGGGNGYCPGRFLARREVFMFVAALVGRFELVLTSSDTRQFPELDLGTPTGGILTPKAGHDVVIRIKPRV